MMRHTTEIKLVNLKDLNLSEAGVIKSEEVRQVIVKDALVDSGASRLSLPEPINLWDWMPLTKRGRGQQMESLSGRFIRR